MDHGIQSHPLQTPTALLTPLPNRCPPLPLHNWCIIFTCVLDIAHTCQTLFKILTNLQERKFHFMGYFGTTRSMKCKSKGSSRCNLIVSSSCNLQYMAGALGNAAPWCPHLTTRHSPQNLMDNMYTLQACGFILQTPVRLLPHHFHTHNSIRCATVLSNPTKHRCTL